jgi:hypothetical protein
MSKNDKPSYYKQLGEMIKTIKKETGWRNIFKIVEEAQKRLKRKKSNAKPD